MGAPHGAVDPLQSTVRKRRLLQYSAWGTVLFILLLIFVGGMVKSTNSGLSVPDWPNTYGHFMFSFPLDRMVGGIFWEHSHRMLASVAGLLTFALTWLVYRYDPRRWVRLTALWASIAVLAQGIMGGLTVLLMLPAWTSSTHGTLAQIYLCLVFIIALAESRHWVESGVRGPAVSDRLRIASWFLVGAAFVQLVLGAVMRHNEAGLVIPDFPTMFGSWSLPLDDESIAFANRELSENGILGRTRLDRVEMHHMVLHLLHRFWAVVVTVLGAVVAVAGIRRVGSTSPGGRWSIGFLVLLVIQVTLGILTIYTEKNPTITTFHVVTGAALLASTVAVAAHFSRVRPFGTSSGNGALRTMRNGTSSVDATGDTESISDDHRQTLPESV